MTNTVIQASTAKAIYQSNGTEATAHAGNSGTIDTANGGLYYWHVTANWIYGRVCLVFDTSGIPAAAIFSLIKLLINPSFRSYNDGVNHKLYLLKKNDWTRPQNPIVAGDMASSLPETKLAEIATNDMSISNWNEWTLPNTGVINSGGSTRFFVWFDYDYDGPAAGTGVDAEFFFVNPPDPTTFPKLDITYTLPAPKCVYGDCNRAVILH